MAKRPTIKDLAEASGVSAATVDRVLNGRQSVRAVTAMRVFEAAKQIGYHATPLIQQRVVGEVPSLHFGLLLPTIEQDFYGYFRAEAERAVATYHDAQVRLSIEFLTASNPPDVAQAMGALGARVDALGVVAVDHPRVTEQVEKLAQRGVPVYAILTEIGQGVREAYVGTNNIKVGRTAASMLARAIPPKHQDEAAREVALFVGGPRWHGHELRETGFRTWLRQNRPDISVLETIVNMDTPELTFEASIALMKRHPRLAGIYCAGGGREGVIRAVREEGKAGRVDVIANELSDVTRYAMADGIVSMVLHTPVFDIMTECFRLAQNALTDGLGASKGQYFLPLHVVLPENL